VYTSATLSLALVETLVHVPSGVLPAYTAVPIEFDDSLVAVVDAADLPPNWKDQPAPPETRAIGDSWVGSSKSALLRVPSVVVPSEFNYVVNPRHPDFGRIRIGAPMPFPFDPGCRRHNSRTEVTMRRNRRLLLPAGRNRRMIGARQDRA
jgi:RES domain-containing protein